MKKLRIMGLPFAFFKVCATNFGDICHAVGQEATEKFLVCGILPVVMRMHSLGRFKIICKVLRFQVCYSGMGPQFCVSQFQIP